MADETAINAEMAEASIVLMLRAGVIGSDDLLQLADEYDLRSGRGSDLRQREVYAATAHRLRCAMLSVDPPPAVDPEVEFRAEFLRRQTRERTALLAARDGGNGD